MGRVCASEEELPVRNLIRTFRFDVLSPEIRDDKVLPRMIACDSSFVADHVNECCNMALPDCRAYEKKVDGRGGWGNL